MGCYEGELPPLDAVDREFAKLDLIREALGGLSEATPSSDARGRSMRV
jgi:hypothetical protein